MKHFCFLLLIFTLACTSEREKDNEFVSGPYRMRWDHKTDSLNIIKLFVEDVQVDSLVLPYPVYRFDYGDLTGDSVPEIVVGVIKSTKYWKVEAKRLFIYHLYHGRYIRPLWLGSRVGNPLEDFSVCRDSFPAVICTKERKRDSTLIYSKYRIQGFGLKYIGGVETEN